MFVTIRRYQKAVVALDTGARAHRRGQLVAVVNDLGVDHKIVVRRRQRVGIRQGVVSSANRFAMLSARTALDWAVAIPKPVPMVTRPLRLRCPFSDLIPHGPKHHGSLAVQPDRRLCRRVRMKANAEPVPLSPVAIDAELSLSFAVRLRGELCTRFRPNYLHSVAPAQQSHRGPRRSDSVAPARHS